MTQGYAAYLRVHGIPRQRHASFSPQVTTPQSGSGPDDGLHEELYGGRMLPENKQALDQCDLPPRGWFIGHFMATGVGLLAKQWSLLAVSH